MEKTDPTARRNSYRIRADRAWALIRARYLRGESAPRLAEVFKVTEAAIRQRIRREGWSKRALAEAEEAGMPEPEEALAELAAEAETRAAGAMDGAELDPRAAARMALAKAVRLMREGRMTGAAEAARVADVMARAAARLDGDGGFDPGEPDEAAFEAVRRKVLGLDPPPQGVEERSSETAGRRDREAVEGDLGESGAGERPAPPPFGRSPSPCGGGF
jgi:hypothetical protein